MYSWSLFKEQLMLRTFQTYKLFVIQHPRSISQGSPEKQNKYLIVYVYIIYLLYMYMLYIGSFHKGGANM